MHPKTAISPSMSAVDKILRAGWAGQLKIHGHRAQIHICSDPEAEVVAYNRHGRPHKKLLPAGILQELRRILPLAAGWTVIDTEWLKPENKLYLFDALKWNNRSLQRLSYAERHELLPKDFISPFIQTLPLLRTVDKCMQVLQSTDENVEGLVFKSLSSKGFSDTSIVRCRKRQTF